MRSTGDEDHEHNQRCDACLEDLNAVMRRHGLVGMLYVAEVAPRVDGGFALYGYTACHFDHIRLGAREAQAIAAQAKRHIRSMSQEMLALAEAESLPVAELLPDIPIEKLN